MKFENEDQANKAALIISIILFIFMWIAWGFYGYMTAGAEELTEETTEAAEEEEKPVEAIGVVHLTYGDSQLDIEFDRNSSYSSSKEAYQFMRNKHIAVEFKQDQFIVYNTDGKVEMVWNGDYSAEVEYYPVEEDEDSENSDESQEEETTDTEEENADTYDSNLKYRIVR